MIHNRESALSSVPSLLRFVEEEEEEEEVTKGRYEWIHDWIPTELYWRGSLYLNHYLEKSI